MKILFLFLFMFCFQNLKAQDKDWFENDKLKHFTATTVVSSTTYLILNENANLSDQQKIGIAISSGILVGIAKESFDQYQYRGWSNQDMIYNLAGSAVGSLLSYGLTKLIQKK